MKSYFCVGFSGLKVGLYDRKKTYRKMLLENMNDAQYWDVIRSVHCLFLSSPVYVKGGAMAEAQKRYYQKKKEAILARIKERYENDEEFRQKKNERSKDWRLRQKKGVLA